MCSCGTTDLDCFVWSTAVSFTYITDLQDVSLPSDFLKFPSPISRFESPVGSPAAVLSSFWFGLEGSRSDCSPLGVSDLRSSAAGPFPPTPPWPGSNFVKYTTAPLSLCDRINCFQWRSLCRVTPDRRESSKSLITTLFLFPSAAESQKWPLEEKKTGPRLRPHRDHSNNRCVFRLHWCVWL